jgi:putative ABC transport system ATP-binding protein
MNALEAKDLYRFYHAGDDEILALRGVTLELARGSMTALVGPSGSGKSTLIACLAGLDEPDGGHVTVDGERMSHRSESERAALRAGKIGILLQSGNLFPHLTIDDNLKIAQLLAKKPDDAKSRAALLGSVELTEIGARYPATLSGGEAARAGLAVALAAAPLVLLADEPTGEVDAVNEAAILRMLRAYRDQGMAILLATHSESLATAADRTLRLRDGLLVA